MSANILPGLVNRGLHALKSQAPFVDIGTPELYARSAAVVACEARLAPADADSPLDHVNRRLCDAAEAQRRTMARCAPAVVRAADLLVESFRSGGKLLLCGNGGSAADCQHMATELVSRLRQNRERRALPALALTTDSSFITAFANDVGYDGIFARQVEAFGRPGDVLLGISTSGRSANVRNAFTVAHTQGMVTIGLFGAEAPLADVVDLAIEVPSLDTQIIQECMLPVEHIICELVEDHLFGEVSTATGNGT